MIVLDTDEKVELYRRAQTLMHLHGEGDRYEGMGLWVFNSINTGRLFAADSDDVFKVSLDDRLVMFYKKHTKTTEWASDELVRAANSEIDRLLLLDDLAAL